MNSRTVERVRSWGTVSVRDGYRGLHDLADDGFSGAVVVDETWLFMLNGRVVGVSEGRIEDFEDAELTAYDAPHMSLPLLFAMEESGGETQATYYTNDTPLSETDDTLSDAGFTGYVELSENVLSGDYYTVYYGGRSMSAAFVGTSDDLVSGDEAFERADDEVGLYEVVKVDIDVTDVPEPAGAAESESDASTAAGAAAGAGVEEAADEPESESASTGAVEEAEPEEPTGPATDASTGASTDDVAEAEPAEAVDPEPDPTPEPEPSAGSDDPTEPEETPAAQRPDAERVEESPSPHAASDGEREGGTRENVRAETAGDDTKFSQEEEWRRTTTVPSLDPEDAVGQAGTAAQARKTKPATSPGRQEPERTQGSTDSREGGETRDVVEKLEAAVQARDDRIAELESEVAESESEAEELRDELADLREERDALREEVESLTEELESAREAAPAAGSAGGGESDRSPEEALSGTNLFVRYDSKADPTLDDVAQGNATPETVNANLRLEHHTQFDTADATVAGEPFESFLEGTAAYRFVSWVVRELPYELLDTGRTNDLADVFDAIADIDRAELNGAVSVRDEEGEEVRSSFDVVLRDRMGNPLVVAELNPERDPVSGTEMEELVTSTETIASAQESLGGAFYVTASFFEPNALETAKDSTGGGGFLSRSDKASFVKVARKSGFHLCLVEDRKGSFHVTVPEL